MSNTYFRFKQFTIHQEHCAMKVTTDACILGAWFAAKVPEYSTILDIGSGTGLLMLMLAQQTEAEIHGIEIQLDCFRQLKQNIKDSPWQDRLRVYPGDVRQFAFPVKFDFILSNPPFFENDLRSESAGEQIAKHSQTLNLEELLEAISRNLQPYGNFGILLPWHRVDAFHQMALKAGYSLTERLAVRQSPKHGFFRGILHYSRAHEGFADESELTITDEQGTYTPEFTELLRAYYLKL